MTRTQQRIITQYRTGTPISDIMTAFNVTRAEIERIIDTEPITEDVKQRIRDQYDDGVGIYTLARLYGVSWTTIDNIVTPHLTYCAVEFEAAG